MCIDVTVKSTLRHSLYKCLFVDGLVKKKVGKSCQMAGEQIFQIMTSVWKLLKQNVAVVQCEICLHFSMCYSYDMF